MPKTKAAVAGMPVTGNFLFLFLLACRTVDKAAGTVDRSGDSTANADTALDTGMDTADPPPETGSLTVVNPTSDSIVHVYVCGPVGCTRYGGFPDLIGPGETWTTEVEVGEWWSVAEADDLACDALGALVIEAGGGVTQTVASFGGVWDEEEWSCDGG